MSHLHDPAIIEQDKRLREAMLNSAQNHAEDIKYFGGWVSALRLRDSAVDPDSGQRDLVDDDPRSERLLADLVRKGLLDRRIAPKAKKYRGQDWSLGHFEYRITEKGVRLLRHHEPVDPDIADDREEVFE